MIWSAISILLLTSFSDSSFLERPSISFNLLPLVKSPMTFLPKETTALNPFLMKSKKPILLLAASLIFLANLAVLKFLKWLIISSAISILLLASFSEIRLLAIDSVLVQADSLLAVFLTSEIVVILLLHPIK